jgi:hypothetical protein
VDIRRRGPRRALPGLREPPTHNNDHRRQIETQNRKLISALRELLDSQKCKVLEGFKDTDNRTHALVGDLVEDLQAQQCRLVEEGLKGTEQRIRTLVVDLVEGTLAQQCRAIVMKRSIEQYGAGNEDN